MLGEVGIQLDSLEKRIMTGNHDAFKQWMDIHIQQIERLAIQYGVTPQEAGKVAETVFGDLYNHLNQLTEDQLEEKALLKTALLLLNEFHVEVFETGIFPFEEDNELHASLLDLPKEEHIAFILSRFHEKSNVEIARVMNKTLVQVNDLLQEARAKLDGPYNEKRFEFLNISYQRIRPAFDERNIFHSKPRETIQIVMPIKKASMPKKPLYLWLIGSAMLIFLLSVTVLRSDALQQSSAEKFIENKKLTFQQEQDERFTLIGLAEPDEYEAEVYVHYFNGTRMKQEVYGKETKWAFNRYISDLERRVNEVGKINKKEANNRYDELIHELRLPSEMLEQLQKNPLSKDREKSMEFLNEFYSKNSYLWKAYMGVLMDHGHIIMGSELFSDGMMDIDKFLEKKSEFPVELQDAIEGMETQFYSLTAIKDYDLSLRYENPEVRETLKQNLHLDMDAYIYLLMDHSNIFYGTYEEHLKTLLELDKQLPKTRESDPLVYGFDERYSWVLYALSGIGYVNDFYDKNLAVKEEVRGKWRQIASIGGNSPAALVMQELVDEMEATNWKPSMENDFQTHIFERIGSKIKEVRKQNE